MRALTVSVLLVAVAFVAAPAARAQEPWTAYRTINIAHQGGEAEAPSNTMYAYVRALKLGADMLEVDVHATADGELVVLHDATVDRTTNGSGYVYDMTLDQVQSLDAGYDFVPGEGTVTGRPESSYPFRGVRTGERAPPPGFRRSDFRIPSLEEVLHAYRDVPINIEIKGRADTDLGSFLHNAQLLAELLNRVGRTDGVIVASFNDAALASFHTQAPQIDLAPGVAGVAAFKLANIPPGPGFVAFQVPITFSGVTVTDADFVNRAHAQGYAVHVWLSNDGENEEIYNHLLDLGVDGIMPAEPTRLEAVLCGRGLARPERPPGWPGGPHCNHDRVSIACSVRAVDAHSAGNDLGITLRRDDEFSGHCAGDLQVRSVLPPPGDPESGSASPKSGGGTLSAAGRFDFGSLPPAGGGPGELEVELALSRAEQAMLRRGDVRLEASARPYDAFATRTVLTTGAAG